MPAWTSPTWPFRRPQRALLLPVDPDGSAETIRSALATRRFGVSSGGASSTTASAAPGAAAPQASRLAAAGLPVADRPARPARSVRPRLQVSIIGFADEIAAAASLLQGAGRRRPARRRRPRSDMDGARRPIANWCARPKRTCSCDRSRCPAASAAPNWRSVWRASCRPRNCSSSSTPATISSISGLSISPDIDTVTYTLAGIANRDRLGPSRRNLVLHGNHGAPSAAKPGSGSAIATSRCMSSAPAACAPAKPCPRSPPIFAAARHRSRVVPMSDDPVRTRLRTDGRLARLPGILRASPLRAGGA
jgi:hypothetical protein